PVESVEFFSGILPFSRCRANGHWPVWPHPSVGCSYFSSLWRDDFGVLRCQIRSLYLESSPNEREKRKMEELMWVVYMVCGC
ncbi:unnamed protein product, partial [Musa acuminata var. zebrina]